MLELNVMLFYVLIIMLYRLKDLEASNEDLKNENQDLKKDLADAESATFKANKDIDVMTNELADLVRTLDELKKQLKSAQ